MKFRLTVVWSANGRHSRRTFRADGPAELLLHSLDAFVSLAGKIASRLRLELTGEIYEGRWDLLRFDLPGEASAFGEYMDRHAEEICKTLACFRGDYDHAAAEAAQDATPPEAWDGIPF